MRSCAPRARRPLHRRPSGLRLRGARARERARGAVRRRDVVPHAGRADRPGALPHAARVRRGGRRRPGRGRSRRARPARRADEPSSARAREPARQPGGRDAHRRARAARRGRRLAARHDARRGREPAHLDRHLPRQRRRGPRVARRAPSADRAARGARSAAGDAGFLARWIAEAARQPPAHARRAPTRDPGALQRLRVHVPDRPGVLAGITQALGAERINIEDFELRPHLARARRHAHRARHGRGRGRAAPRRCSRRRATASSSRRCSTSEDRARRRALVGHVAVPGRQVDLAPRGAARRGRRRRDRITRLRPLRRHRVDDRGACARSAPRSTRRTSTSLRVHGVGLRGLTRAGGADRLRATPDAAAAPRRACSPGQDGRFELVGDESLSRRPMERDRRAAARDGRARRDDRRPRSRSSSRAGRCAGSTYELPVASAQVKSAVLLAGLYAKGRRPSSSPRRRATTRS